MLLHRRSPAHRRASVDLKHAQRDPFEVLSDEAIHKVLLKLSKEHATAWIRSSPKVRRVAESHGMMMM
jgi:hypothetical protein